MPLAREGALVLDSIRPYGSIRNVPALIVLKQIVDEAMGIGCEVFLSKIGNSPMTQTSPAGDRLKDGQKSNECRDEHGEQRVGTESVYDRTVEKSVPQPIHLKSGCYGPSVTTKDDTVVLKAHTS